MFGGGGAASAVYTVVVFVAHAPVSARDCDGVRLSKRKKKCRAVRKNNIIA